MEDRVYSSIAEFVGHTPLVELTNFEKEHGLKAQKRLERSGKVTLYWIFPVAILESHLLPMRTHLVITTSVSFSLEYHPSEH